MEKANDMKAMREALLCILEIAERDMPNYCRSRARDQGETESIMAWSNTIVSLAKNALSKPSRQCDVGTICEQYNRFEEFCMSHYQEDGVGHCSKCPFSEPTCKFAWAQTPYEEGGAK